MPDALLTLSIPYLPPSVNTHYMFRVQGGRIKVALSAAAAKWKADAALFMGPHKLRDEKYRVQVILVSKWHDKTEEPLRKDCRNHGKLAVDALFERYGKNDKWVWDDRVLKVDDDEVEGVIIRLWPYVPEELGLDVKKLLGRR